MADSLLIIEDEPLLGGELQLHYQDNGYETVWVRSLAEAEQLLLSHRLEPAVVLSDMSLPDGNALSLLEKIRARQIGGEWILLTGYGGVPDSVRALRLGAYDFLTKPCKQDRLDVVVSSATRSAQAQQRLRDEAQARSRRYTAESFAGHSPQSRKVRELLRELSAVPFSALVIHGETGTGKGLAARILHHSGIRGQGPLVEVNCAALPRELMESELFGHEPGAFTGARTRRRGLIEQAHRGTLFLDEIGELGPDLQAKLLTAIENRTFRRLGGEKEISVDIQIIAATNQDLESATATGGFRPDLFHRLSVFQLRLPPLRERKSDLRDLVPVFLAETNAKAGKRVSQIDDEVWTELYAYAWPGNVRELRNVVERCVLLSKGETLPMQWLQLGIRANRDATVDASLEGERLCLPLDGTMALDEMERHIIQTALERHGYNVTGAARALGTTRETLRYRIQKYALKHTSK